MAVMCASYGPRRVDASGHFLQRRGGTLASLVASAAFVLAVIAIAAAGRSPATAVYALSGWHYLLYFLAYYYGDVPPAVFRRDAVLMKTVALAALAAAYASAPVDIASLAVIAAGFLLNTAAAAALGTERTYYGHELAGLAPRHITAFPYSLTAHPMLYGNVLAFGGTLLNEAFRDAWWPLAAAHVALNLGLLGMETQIAPRRRGARVVATGRRAPRCGSLAATVAVALGAAAGAVLARAAGHPVLVPGAALGACAAAYACVLYVVYTCDAAHPEGDCP